MLEAGLGNTIQQWQVNALIDSISEDEDEGDVEYSRPIRIYYVGAHSRHVPVSSIGAVAHLY